MATCQKCHKKWTWKQTLRQSFSLGASLKCPYCSEKQYLTTKTRKKAALVSFFIPLILLLRLLFNLPVGITLFLLFFTTIISIVVYPLWVELSNEDESLF